jgi:hypothetical protein
LRRFEAGDRGEEFDETRSDATFCANQANRRRQAATWESATNDGSAIGEVIREELTACEA